MKKKYSLKRNEEIAKIIQQRKFVKNNCFIIYYQKNSVNSFSRICISVGKKNGNAVVRNKIKRQIRSMIDVVFNLNEKKDYVVIVRSDFQNNSYADNTDKLNELYSKINLI